MPETATLRTLQARKAAAQRWGRPDSTEAARDYAAAKLEAHIAHIVSTAPPLTEAQRDRLATLLRGEAA